MRFESFQGPSLAAVDALAREAFGEEAIILRTRTPRGRVGLEVIAAPASLLPRLDRLVRLVTPPAGAPPHRRAARPRVVALVGPTGAGKTTTLAKLATNPDAFGTQRVGLLTLDTHRAAGFDQLSAYADAAGLPCAIAYDPEEAAAALRTFADCDVVLIDTAGRGPAKRAQAQQSAALLARLKPDEVHLVVPATLRQDVVAGLRAMHTAHRPTHALLTKLDEVPADFTLAAMTSVLDLPMRWVTDGQDVPQHLKHAAPAILGPAGLGHRAGVAA